MTHTAKINIVFLIDQMDIGGTEKQLVETIRLLDKTMFTIHLICLRDTEYLQSLDIPCQKVIFPTTSLLSWNGLKMLCKFVRFLKDEQVDIVQTFFIDSNIFGVIGARLAGIKKIIVSRRDLGFWYTPRLLFILNLVNKLADQFLVNSKAIKRVVSEKEKIQPERIKVIYNGIDLEKFSGNNNHKLSKTDLGIPEADTIVGIVANLNRPVKRVDVFINAAAEVLKVNNNVSFVIIGEGHLRPSLEKQAGDLKIGKKIFFLGSRTNVFDYLKLFHIGVNTSDSEGFSNSILEYMAAGLPIVCSNNSGNSELVKNRLNGIIFEIGNYNDLSNKIINLINNQETRNKMGVYNLNNIANFDRKLLEQRLAEYYII